MTIPVWGSAIRRAIAWELKAGVVLWWLSSTHTTWNHGMQYCCELETVATRSSRRIQLRAFVCTNKASQTAGARLQCSCRAVCSAIAVAHQPSASIRPLQNQCNFKQRVPMQLSRQASAACDASLLLRSELQPIDRPASAAAAPF